MPAQNVRQIPAAVLHHVVAGSAAIVVLGARVGAVFDEQLDDLLAVPRVPVRVVQRSASYIVSDIHVRWIFAQQGADTAAPRRATQQLTWLETPGQSTPLSRTTASLMCAMSP